MRTLRLSNVMIVLLAVGWAPAATRLVPNEYPNIQAAINDCNNGDIVIIADGVYTGSGNRNIDFLGKAITVQSLNGPGGCTIDCEKQGRGFHFHGGEDENSVVAGLTVTRSYTFDYGGGILCEQSSPTISNCIFLQNIATRGGGAANMSGSNSKIINCVFIGNNAAYDGGVHNWYSSPQIINCTFVDNKGTWGPGGIGNWGKEGNAGTYAPVITNCLLWANWSRTLTDHSAQLGIYGSSPVISYCCIQDWTDALPGADNIYSDPLLFADNYHLTDDSPCIDAGETNEDNVGRTDVDGQERIGRGRVDIGADESHGGTTVIMVEPKRFDLSHNIGDSPLEPQLLSISGGLDGSMRWAISENCDWVEVSPDCGESTGEVDAAVITIKPNDLAVGTHTCILAVSDPNAVNSPQHATVTLDIQRPVIGVHYAALNFTVGRDEPRRPSQSFLIYNDNLGVLNWRITSDCDYLSARPATGRSSGDINEVVAEVETAGLEYGEHTCHLTIEDPNAVNTPKTVPVSVNVVRPEIGFYSDSFEFSCATGHFSTGQTLYILNKSKGLLNWGITCDCNWLIIEPDNGVSQQGSGTAALRPDTSSLALRDYACTVTISGPNAPNNPQTLPVTLHVLPGVMNVPADYATIQGAIDNAGEGAEVVVHPGTHMGEGNYRIYFRGKAITVRSIDPNDPGVVAATIVDCNGRGGGFIFDDDEDVRSVLSGLTIVNSRGSIRGGGGPAIGCYGSGPVISNCTITCNSGGGIHVMEGDPQIKNCTIVNNVQDYFGGGINVDYESFAAIENCTISGNSAYDGGGIYCSGNSELVIRDSLISGNKSKYSGGGIYCRQGDVVISGCTISGNAAHERGGGIYCYQGDVVISGCTIAGNAAGERAGGLCSIYGSPVISNSILWGNTAPVDRQIVASNCPVSDPRGGGPMIPVVISYSDIEGGQAAVNVEAACSLNWGPGNVDIDPCFAEPGYWGHVDDPDIHVEPNDPNAAWVEGDYHLKSEYGRWDANSKTWVFDEVTSLCIDSGDPNLDWSAELWPHGKRINLGAYGGTVEASMSPNEVGNVADLDLDGFVYRTDLPFFLGAWLSEAAPLREDLTRDGTVDFPDFSVFAGHYKRPLPPPQAEVLSPPDGAMAVARTPTLSWLSEPNALWHDVYLGTASPGIFQGRISTTTFEPNVLSKNTWYYWRIDEINPGGTTTGEVWRFQTRLGPDPASSPNPADGSVGINTYPLLSWEPGEGAASHDVYFGTSNPGDFKGNQVETTFTPGYLLSETTYYWRIDEVNDLDTTKGPVWRFTTVQGSR